MWCTPVILTPGRWRQEPSLRPAWVMFDPVSKKKERKIAESYKHSDTKVKQM